MMSSTDIPGGDRYFAAKQLCHFLQNGRNALPGSAYGGSIKGMAMDNC